MTREWIPRSQRQGNIEGRPEGGWGTDADILSASSEADKGMSFREWQRVYLGKEVGDDRVEQQQQVGGVAPVNGSQCLLDLPRLSASNCSESNKLRSSSMCCGISDADPPTGGGRGGGVSRGRRGGLAAKLDHRSRAFSNASIQQQQQQQKQSQQQQGCNSPTEFARRFFVKLKGGHVDPPRRSRLSIDAGATAYDGGHGPPEEGSSESSSVATPATYRPRSSLRLKQGGSANSMTTLGSSTEDHPPSATTAAAGTLAAPFSTLYDEVEACAVMLMGRASSKALRVSAEYMRMMLALTHGEGRVLVVLEEEEEEEEVKAEDDSNGDGQAASSCKENKSSGSSTNSSSSLSSRGVEFMTAKQACVDKSHWPFRVHLRVPAAAPSAASSCSCSTKPTGTKMMMLKKRKKSEKGTCEECRRSEQAATATERGQEEWKVISVETLFIEEGGERLEVLGAREQQLWTVKTTTGAAEEAPQEAPEQGRANEVVEEVTAKQKALPLAVLGLTRRVSRWTSTRAPHRRGAEVKRSKTKDGPGSATEDEDGKGDEGEGRGAQGVSSAPPVTVIDAESFKHDQQPEDYNEKKNEEEEEEEEKKKKKKKKKKNKNKKKEEEEGRADQAGEGAREQGELGSGLEQGHVEVDVDTDVNVKPIHSFASFVVEGGAQMQTDATVSSAFVGVHESMTAIISRHRLLEASVVLHQLTALLERDLERSRLQQQEQQQQQQQQQQEREQREREQREREQRDRERRERERMKQSKQALPPSFGTPPIGGRGGRNSRSNCSSHSSWSNSSGSNRSGGNSGCSRHAVATSTSRHKERIDKGTDPRRHHHHHHPQHHPHHEARRDRHHHHRRRHGKRSHRRSQQREACTQTDERDLRAYPSPLMLPPGLRRGYLDVPDYAPSPSSSSPLALASSPYGRRSRPRLTAGRGMEGRGWREERLSDIAERSSSPMMRGVGAAAVEDFSPRGPPTTSGMMFFGGKSLF